MRVLILHGYLLRGTGSNVYNASLAPALARLGHEVHLLCQDREPHDWPGPGSVNVHVPDIAGLLPVFVRDRYEGFEVKTFSELTDVELERYIALNVDAVRAVVESAGAPDAALANHLVMGPSILARAGLEFAVKVHGSDLSYTVLPDLDRFRPYAIEAVDAANGVLVGSAHIADRLREAVGNRADAKLRLGPPGVDTALFSPLATNEHRARLEQIAKELRTGNEGGRTGPEEAGRVRGTGDIRRDERSVPSGTDTGRCRSGGWERTVRGRDAERPPGREPDPPPTSWGRDLGAAAVAVDHLAAATGPRVVFVGKLIVSKGTDLLLTAWPLVHAKDPGARLLIVGFGALESALRRLWASLEAGDLAFPRELAARGWALEGGPEGRLSMLASFLERCPASYPTAAKAAAGSVAFAGRLEHREVGRLVPACDALVFPSTFPEAFGMVAAEAASAGVLPVSAQHSGAAEVSEALAGNAPGEARALLSFALDANAVTSIAERLNGWLALDEPARERTREAMRRTVVRLWSWEGVARGVLAASAGRLDELSPVAG